MSAEVEIAAELPTAAGLQDLLNGLFDRTVTVFEVPQPVLRGRDVHVVGSYIDDQGGLQAVVFCDLVLGTVLGAALALIPAPRVQEALKARRVPTDLADNTREVLNIGASLFNHQSAHVKLKDTWVVPEPVDAEVVEFLRQPGRRVDFRVDVPGYGEGVLALLVV
ncbi:MAG: hypothetical protein JWM02_1923 [Frankiales bacterium]|nr:hypothetical protein [Frankiales bacterium]